MIASMDFFGEGGVKVRLSAPTKKVFLAAVIVAIIGIVLYIVSQFVLPVLNVVGFVVLAVAFILLAISVCFKNV
ncbi:MAG: hypothetical protein RBR58_01790 [Candidatus Humimicrobiaceae bacterium]|jgi:hypothetical protein|nr:hypothetical protein [Actinomycetota bacterium]MDD5600222.1 hypothetical protein [Actinomycetota bacterium]MDY0027717.1 hypothetical protein [Candidatus Humimicrobiaceae bacterium]